MLRTEADMIVNHVNHHHIDHHHIDHHQDIIYNILNLLNFSTVRNHPSISTMIMKKIGWPIEGVGDSPILTLIGEAGFQTLIGTCFLILLVAKEEDIQILMSFLILFFFLWES